jgi:hypothetical protein
MSDLVNEISNHTGISSDLVQKGLGAILSFLKKELGDETFAKVQSSIPDASRLTTHYESSPEATQPHGGGLLDLVTGLAGKLLGGKAGEGVDLLAVLAKLGFKPEQIEAFLPKAFEFIKSHLSPELVQQVMAAFPAIAKMLKPEASQTA